jgi:hypothetical protein
MTDFSARTGLESDAPGRRYLWTDAFAVCNFLGLAAATGDGRFRDLALRTIQRVHAVLGRHRGDDGRSGWLSGPASEEADAHPTRGGLRIGKPLPERRLREPIDARLEWDRDGQYFHYLTKWMHALDQTARATGDTTFEVWARELAAAAHRAFVYATPGTTMKRMHWKMSIDLTRALVESMGQHDPLDGLVTCVQLDATAAALGTGDGPRLRAAAADFAAMVRPDELATGDPLGLGGLLSDACRIAQLMRAGAWSREDPLLQALLSAAALGIRQYARQPDLRAPASHRLAFRELGLAIGLAGVARLRVDAGASGRVVGALAELAPHLPLGAEIVSFWVTDEHRRQPTWLEHRDINDVMLATALAPAGFLELRDPPRR